MSDLSWLNPTPHAIAVYASRPLSPVAAQHSLPSGRYSLLGPDFHRLDRTSLRLAHSLDHFAHNAFIRISAVRRKDDAEQHPLVHAFLLLSTDMSTAIRRDDVIDLVTRNRHPVAVYLHFV